MYIIKNALRCISRSKGRSILIGIIALVIAVSACIGLSIQQAAESAKESALEGVSITATISYDRAGAMGKISGGFSKDSKGGEFDRSQFSGLFGNESSLTLEEYQNYATASSVSDFYYTLTAYVNSSDAFLAVSDENSFESTDTEESSSNNLPSGNPGGMNEMFGDFSNGDFTIIGYSSDVAMTSFINGTLSILEGGVMFDEGTESLECVISEELALYNNLLVGDSIVITNPSAEEETYTLMVVGIYTGNESSNFSMFGASQDPANQIYMSATALQQILDASALVSTTTTDTNGNETETKLSGSLDATYVFADVDAYEAFEEEARALGLGDDYQISSSDLSSYESRLTPLNTLSTMAKTFLIVILIIGAIILVVLNIFSVRERKYEVGVLTAMGMKKWKVAMQFMCEILVITMLAVLIGAGVGAVSSVPITNALLENQVASQNTQQSQIESGFGREGNFGGSGGGMPGNMPNNMPNNMPTDMPSDISSNFSEKNVFSDFFGGASDYITEVDSAMNLMVVLEMIIVGLLLTLVASAASVLFIMRYDPLKILANRD